MGKFIQVGKRIINTDWVVEFVRKDYKTGTNIMIHIGVVPEAGSDPVIIVNGEQTDELWNWLQDNVDAKFLKLDVS